MSPFSRLKNRAIASVLTRFPSLARRFTDVLNPYTTSDPIPWTSLKKELHESRLALVSTCGVHQRDQKPFDMNDPEGDPSFRLIQGKEPVSNLMITHDYYDHSDADKDINVVFPIERMREFAHERVIGTLAKAHFGFMGHVTGRHVDTLIEKTAPEVAGLLKADEVDVVLLTPA